MSVSGATAEGEWWVSKEIAAAARLQSKRGKMIAELLVRELTRADAELARAAFACCSLRLSRSARLRRLAHRRIPHVSLRPALRTLFVEATASK